MQTIIINDATPEYRGDTLTSRHVLALRGTDYRAGVGAVARDGWGNTDNGVATPGPWAYTYGLCTVIAANPEMSTGAAIRRNRAEGIEHDVEAGDIVEFDRIRYRVRVERRQYIMLDRIEDLDPAATAAGRPIAEAKVASVNAERAEREAAARRRAAEIEAGPQVKTVSSLIASNRLVEQYVAEGRTVKVRALVRDRFKITASARPAAV